MAIESLYGVVEDIAKDNNFENPNIAIKPISSGGANYSSLLYNITISESGKEDLRLFAKTLAVKEAIRKQLPAGICDVERSIYVELLKKYEDIEIAHNVPSDKRLLVSKYYGCNTKLFEETVILEDLSAKGYTTYDRFKSIDWDYTAKAMESLAKFHALSIAFSEENPQEYKEFVEKMEFQRELFTGMMYQFYEQRIETTLSVITENHKNKLKEYLETHINLESIIKLCKSSERPVLCHGDYRPSNLLHRYKEDGTLEIIPVDFQNVQCNSPITDLIYFVLMGSDENFRREHYENLTKHYYQEMCNALRFLKLDPDVVYPKSVFDHDLKKFLPHGLFMAIFGLPIITVEEEDAPSVQGGNAIENFTRSKTGALYPERINGVINDFIRWGIIE
ncbi:uncharacterized kinase-like protein D1044.1 [Achroia grisella]|uniref:uncharacterized kinase-like protein D1044.1 n=1 Tax=Achroia grisella TaxID=688607 RepID=UPI0027D265C7|nr:uncharacterized kinase-like protein D1044.1 [Achroia grisella]